MATDFKSFISGKAPLPADAIPKPAVVTPQSDVKKFIQQGPSIEPPKLEISINPTTRAINIAAPQWYLDTEEFQQQVLPEFQKLKGKNITDNQFKALIDSGTQQTLQEQVEALLPRQTAIEAYRARFPKATTGDALVYLRNVAAAERSDDDEETKIATGTTDDGSISYAPIKTALKNFNSYSDREKGEMLKASQEMVEKGTYKGKPISETDRAATLGLLQFLEEKGALNASAVTKTNLGLKTFLANKGGGVAGEIFNFITKLNPTDFGSGVSDQARKQLENDPSKNLIGADEGIRAGDIAATVGGLGSDLALTQGRSLPAALAKIPGLAKVGSVVDELPDIMRGGKTVAQTLKQVPNDIAFGATQAIQDPEYDGVQDFIANTAINAATLGGAKIIGRGLSSVDTATNGALNRASTEVSKKIYKGKELVQSVPLLGKGLMKFTDNFVDQNAPVKRVFDNAFANAKGAKATAKAKDDLYAINNVLRQASQVGQPESTVFRTESPSWKEAISVNKQLADAKQLPKASDYVNKATILARAEAGQYQMKPEALQDLRDEVARLQTPEAEMYRQTVAGFTKEVTDLGTANGIYDADLIKYMEDNPEFADQYIQLQQDVTSTKNPYTGKGSTRNLKNTAPIKKIKGTSDVEFGDPLLTANQRLELTQRIISQNRVARMIEDAVNEGTISGRVITDAADAKALNKLKVEAGIEKDVVKAALNDELQGLGADLNRLSEDVSDFTGSGQVIIGDRIDQSVDTMIDKILDEPKIADEITKLADQLGDGREGVEMTAAVGILHRQKAEIVKTVDKALEKADIAPSERKMITDQFKQNITDRFDALINQQGKGIRTGARELNERRDEIRRLKAEIGTVKERQGENVISSFRDGQKSYIELDDPEVAEYFTKRQTPIADGIFTRFLTQSSRLFRMGTTGLDPVFGLLVNPARDIPQGTVLAGVKTFAPTQLNRDFFTAAGYSPEEAARMVDEIQNVKNTNIGQSTFTRLARGESTDRVTKPAFWENKGGTATRVHDRQEYKRLQAEDRDASRGKSKYVINALVPTRAIKNAENIFSNVEYATRSAVFNSRYKAALQRGATPDAAEREALFYAAEATTNFLNVGSQTQKMLRTLPYLSAAINGTMSFNRLWALDPIGVSARMFAGIALPASYLTINNLKPENIAGYSQIPDYTRRTNFIIMLNGEDYIKIPMSYQLAAVINPFRDAIETHHDVDPQSFEQIMIKNILGSGPIDLSGFATTDFEGNIDVERAAAQTASSFLPQGLRPALEQATGESLYTGANLNPSDQELIDRGQVDPTQEIKNSDRTYKTRNSQSLGAIADFLGVPQGTVQNYFNSYTGTVGSYLLNAVDKLTGAPSTAQGGLDVAEQAQKRFLGSVANGGQATTDYYAMIDRLNEDKESLQSRLARLDRTSTGDEDVSTGDAATNDKRQKLIDEYGQKVADSVNRFGDYYQRVGGLKPYQVDSVINLLNLGPDGGVFDAGTYQAEDLATVRNEARNDARRRAQDLGLQSAAARDLYGRTTEVDGEDITDYYNTTLPNGIFRNRVYGAPKQIAYEFSEVTKADRKKGIPSLYDLKSQYDDRVSKLYEEAKGLKGAAATAKYKEISDVQEAYMNEVFDVRIRPLIEKYGAEVLRNSSVAKEITQYVEVPGDFTPFASKKKQPYLTDDTFAFLKDRYGVGNLNQQNLQNDAQAERYLTQINSDLQAGRSAAANFKLSELDRKIKEGQVLVNAETMDQIAGRIKALNKR